MNSAHRILPVLAVFLAALLTQPALADVTATFSSGVLRAVSNGDGDSILIRASSDGGVAIKGRLGTIVNGVADGVFSTSNSAINVVVRMNDGTDEVIARNFSIGGRLDISCGNDRDRVTVDNVGVGDVLRVIGGSGNDDLVVKSSMVLTNVNVFMGGGADLISFDDTDVVGLLRAVGATGDNSSPPTTASECIKLTNGSAGSLSVQSGNGPDTIVLDGFDVDFDSSLITNLNDDQVRIESSILSGNLRAGLGSGNDDLLLHDVDLSGDLTVIGSQGNDVFIQNQSTIFGNTLIDAGGNHDKLMSIDCTTGNPSNPLQMTFDILCRGGNDQVFALRTVFNVDGLIDGELGTDQLAFDDLTVNGPLVDQNFEGDSEPDWVTCLAELLLIDCQ